MTDKLSYDIISLIALIDRIKRAADRCIWNDNQIANTNVNNIEPRNIPLANDINEMVSDLGAISSDQFSLIVASGYSGLGTLTGLVNPIGLGNLTTGGANISSGENVISSPLDVEYCVTAPSLVPIPSDRRAPTVFENIQSQG